MAGEKLISIALNVDIIDPISYDSATLKVQVVLLNPLLIRMHLVWSE